MRRRSERAGFSFVEVVLSIVILSASFLAFAHVLSSTTVGNINIDLSTTAILLGQGKMAEVKAKSFENISSVAETGFGGNFNNYQYGVSVIYVDPGDLNTSVVGPTDYKRIVVIVTATGWVGNIQLTDLRTDTQ